MPALPESTPIGGAQPRVEVPAPTVVPAAVPAPTMAAALVPAPAEDKKVYDVVAPALVEAAPPGWWHATLYAAAGGDDDSREQLVVRAAPPPPANSIASVPAVPEGLDDDGLHT